MEAEFIPYEQALALKELGFDEPCIGFYTTKSTFVSDYKVTKLQIDSLGLEKCCLAPLYQQAFRWFRKKYNLDGSMSVDVWNKKTTSYRITGGIKGIIEADSYGGLYDIDSKDYDTYEEAELECLLKLIEIVKEKK
jgi:hypothetical protein